jgi:hypothetical protein
MELELQNEDKLDESWIKNFDEMDIVYSDYYKSDLYFVKLTFIYVNIENEIFKIKEELFFLKNPNLITREELIAIIKKNSILFNKRHSLLSLLKFNFTIDPENIKSLLKTEENLENPVKKYITVLKNIDEIGLDKTIGMYHELNNIIIIYYEKIQDNDNNLYNKLNSNNTTKKVYLHKYSSNHKKTLRK